MDQDSYWRAVEFIDKLDRSRPDTSEVGWIYAIRNTEFRRSLLLKIGMTTHPPHTRAEQLASTGVPGTFELVYCIHTVNARIAEAHVHEALEKYRLSPNKEFFEAPIGEVVSAFERVAHSLPVRGSLARSGRYNEKSKPLPQPFPPLVVSCKACQQKNRVRVLAIAIRPICKKCSASLGTIRGIY